MKTVHKSDVLFGEDGFRSPNRKAGEVLLSKVPEQDLKKLEGVSCYTTLNHGFVLYGVRGGMAWGFDRKKRAHCKYGLDEVIVKP